MKSNVKSIITIIALIAVVIAAVSFLNMNKEDTNPNYSEIISMLGNDEITEFKVDGNYVMTYKALVKKLDDNKNPVLDAEGNPVYEVDKDGKLQEREYSFSLQSQFQLEEINTLARANYEKGGNLRDYNYEAPAETPWYVSYLPFVIILLLFVGMWFFVIRQSGGGGKMNGFARSKAKVSNDKNTVRFADVAGADEEKAELVEVVEFLKDPSRFVKLGARIPRGVLLVGPPGTGKTLLAKAVAGEAGVPFFSISGSDFVEMYVGVGASRVRDLFDNARKTPASIIFIDEIDAVGRHRGAGLGGGHDEREQTLNQLLVEMDGFGTNSGVIVMAATNRPDILDPALLRPGRFDRTVTVNYPDIKGRAEILKVHCRNKPLEEGVELEKIAQTTIGFTGAELANLMNEAALLAAKRNKSLIGMNDIEDAYMKMLMGPQKKAKVRSEADNKLCAYHEAGHAVASYYCKHTDPVKHITIIPAGNAGGVTISVPTEDKLGKTKNEMLDRIVLCLGGRVAEEIVLDDISTGASNDIQQATGVARNMVTRYGMSDKLGTVLYGSEHSADEVFLGRDFSSGKNYSEQTAATIDEEIRSIVSTSYDRCKAILTEHIDKLHFVAQFLLKYESMDDEQFAAAMASECPDMEAIEAIATERKRRSEEENRAAMERAEKKRLDDEAIAKAREEQVKEALEELRREKSEKIKTDNLCDDIFANFREFTDKNNNGVPDDWEVSVDDVDPDPLKKDENTDKNDSDK
ncbi:MAG: ATP-dependent zinc metalloprotease FtsH [Clostridia bacterium]|nr:ATP-dependent zinc metalloprotease FtsH [Clostridia bacterium]